MLHLYIADQMQIFQAGIEDSCLTNLLLLIQSWHLTALSYLLLWWEREAEDQY